MMSMTTLSATSPARPSALPDAWIEKIFRELHGAFGNRFTSAWTTGQTNGDGIDVGVLNARRVWAEKLAGFRNLPDALGYGIRCAQDLPYPPSVGEFVSLCRQAPKRALPALPEPAGEMTDAVRARMDQIIKPVCSSTEPLEVRAAWAIDILKSIGQRKSIALAVEQCAVAALKNLGALHLAPRFYIEMERPTWIALGISTYNTSAGPSGAATTTARNGARTR